MRNLLWRVKFSVILFWKLENGSQRASLAQNNTLRGFGHNGGPCQFSQDTGSRKEAGKYSDDSVADSCGII
jgi:hypothetical protein